jgi:hypothetical protein
LSRRQGCVVTRLPASLVRRSWIVGACVVLAVIAAVAVAAVRDSDYYRARAVFEVPASGGAGDTTKTAPGVVATTYLDVILSDQAIVRRIAGATGLAPPVARSRLTATQDVNTSVIRVTFVGPTAAAAASGRDAVVSAVVGSDAASTSIPAGGLELLDGTGVPQRVARDVPGGPVPIGAILGLIVGIAALIAWDRWDPRVDSAAVLHDDLGIPATRLDAQTPALALEAIALRWRDLTASVTDPSIVLVPGSPAAQHATKRAAARLRELGALRGTEVVVADPPGSASGGELAAVRASFVVLVEQAGGSLRCDRRTVADLGQLGVAPGWAILVTRE